MLHQHVSLRSAYQRDSSFNVNFILFYGFSERYLLPKWSLWISASGSRAKQTSLSQKWSARPSLKTRSCQEYFNKSKIRYNILLSRLTRIRWCVCVLLHSYREKFHADAANICHLKNGLFVPFEGAANAVKTNTQECVHTNTFNDSETPNNIFGHSKQLYLTVSMVTTSSSTTRWHKTGSDQHVYHQHVNFIWTWSTMKRWFKKLYKLSVTTDLDTPLRIKRTNTLWSWETPPPPPLPPDCNT